MKIEGAETSTEYPKMDTFLFSFKFRASNFPSNQQNPSPQGLVVLRSSLIHHHCVTFSVNLLLFFLDIT